jgi:hypothetical protein
MRSAIAAMRAFISPRKAQLVLKGQILKDQVLGSQVLKGQVLKGQVLKGQVLERHVTLPGSSFAPGVNRMGIKSAATLSPIPPPRKGKGEIR